jgi:hypothetical protein
MKSQVLQLLILCLWLGACTLEDQDNPLVAPTCYDGMLNQDEQKIDCGGRCLPCKVYIPVRVPCSASLTENKIVVKGATLLLTSSDYAITEKTAAYYDEPYHEIYILKNSYEIIIQLAGKLPVKDSIYPVTQVLLEDGYSIITLSQVFGVESFRSSAGEVYVTHRNGKMYVEFCTVTMLSPYSNFTLMGSVSI